MLDYNWLNLIDSWEQERCGVILNSGEVIELPNSHPSPLFHFRILSEDISPYKENVVGVWHTHLNGDFNLSMDDYECFKSLPDYSHYIISDVGVAKYVVESDMVMNDSWRKF